MFADTGMKYMLDRLLALGANKKRLIVKIAGGAQMMNDANTFQIGKRNHAAIRQYLWRNKLFLDGEAVGGTYARTLSMNLLDGIVRVRSNGKTIEL